MWDPNSSCPRPPSRIGLALLGALSLAGAGPLEAAGLTSSCHIHPPAELVERGEQPSTIGPYPSSSACEAERLARFGNLGRCHCTQSFAPWPGADKAQGSPRDPGRPLPPLP